jgi:hypothetical protein
MKIDNGVLNKQIEKGKRYRKNYNLLFSIDLIN